MSTTQSIQAAATKHSELLQGIAELDYAPSAYEQSTSYLQDLSARKEEADQALKNLLKKTEKERQEHLDLQKSVARKWANKLVGRGDKFAEKATKEEREFLESLEREMEGRGTAERLAAEYEGAKQANQELKAACQKRERLQREVVELYNTIFGGTTSEFPQEDEMENFLRLAEGENDRAQSRLNTLAQGLASLNDAAKMTRDCVKKMEDARMYSGDDIWGFGGRGADMMEANSLTSAQMLASQVDMLVNQARRFDPAIGQVPNVRIPQTSMTDVYFDNIFTDLDMHDKIKTAQSAVLRAQAKLLSEIRASEDRVEAEAYKASKASEALARARRQLHEMREATFLSVATNGAPPAFPESAAASNSEGSAPRSTSPSFKSSQGSPQISMPPPAPSASVSSGPSNWGSMNPYAALLAGKVKKGENGEPGPQ